MKKRAKVGLGILVGLTCLAAGLTIVAHQHRPRTALSQELKFLTGIEPTKVEVRVVDDGPPDQRIFVVESFALKQSADSVERKLNEELGPRLTYEMTDFERPARYFHVDPNALGPLQLIGLDDRGPQCSALVITAPQDPNPLERFFAWIRHVTGGK